MDKQFMEHYYKLAYTDDPVGQFTMGCKEHEEIQRSFDKAQDKVLELVGGMGSPGWELVEQMLDYQYASEVVLAKLAYMRGAEDREKMLR